MIRPTSNRVMRATRQMVNQRRHSVSSGKDAFTPLSVSSSPFKSQEMCAAALHRAKRLNEVKSALRGEGVSRSNKGPSEPTSYTPPTGKNSDFATGSKSISRSVSKVSRNEGNKVNIVNVNEKVLVVTTRKPKASIADKPFTTQGSDISGSNFLKRRSRPSIPGNGKETNSLVMKSNQVKGPMQQMAKEQQKLMSQTQTRSSPKLEKEALVNSKQAVDAEDESSGIVIPITVLGVTGIVGGLYYMDVIPGLQ